MVYLEASFDSDASLFEENFAEPKRPRLLSACG